eukprot:1640246-Rhodomonas_salina.1
MSSLTLRLFVLATLCCAIVAQPALTCDGGTHFSNKCFFYDPTDVPWEEAHQNCIAWGGNLARPENQLEQEFIYNTLTGGSGGWLGLKIWAGGSPAYWADGTNYTDGVDYNDWAGSEPSFDNTVNCVEIMDISQWNDYICEATSKGQICSFYSCPPGQGGSGSGSSLTCAPCNIGEFATSGPGPCETCTNKPATSQYTAPGANRSCPFECDDCYVGPNCAEKVLCPPCELGFYSTVSVEESNCLECQSMCQPCQNAPEFSSYVYNESGVVTSNGECPFQCDACLSGPDCAERELCEPCPLGSFSLVPSELLHCTECSASCMTCPPLSENAVYIPIDESFWASLENQAQEFGSGSGTLSGSGSFGNFGMMCPFECLECFSGEDCSI